MNILKRFVFTFIFEWEQIIPHFNWYTFTPIKVEFEYDKMLQGVEVCIVILGIGFIIRYNLPSSDKIFAKFEDDIKKLCKKTKKSKTKTKR